MTNLLNAKLKTRQKPSDTPPKSTMMLYRIFKGKNPPSTAWDAWSHELNPSLGSFFLPVL